MQPSRLRILSLLALLAALPSARAREQPEQVWCAVCGNYVDAEGGRHDFSDRCAGRCPRLADGRLCWNDSLERWEELPADAPEPEETEEEEEERETPAETPGEGGEPGAAGGDGAGEDEAQDFWRTIPPWGWLVAVGAAVALFLAPLFRTGKKQKRRIRYDVPLLQDLVCSSEDVGDGGTAEVHPALFGRKTPAVVKRMRNGKGGFGEKNFSILEYEASVLRRLAPTHVVPKLLVPPTRTELGAPPRVDVWEYYAMSVAAGRSWPESGGPGGRDETRRALAALCEALVRLHELGIGHHDLKPRNVFWDGRRVTLLDFGSAVDHRDGEPDRLKPNPLADKDAGSVPWKPPLSDGKVLADLSTASDAWVYGLIFCESLSPGCISAFRTRHDPARPADREWLRDMVSREAGSAELADWVVDGLFAIDKGRRPSLEKFLGELRNVWREV